MKRLIALFTGTPFAFALAGPAFAGHGNGGGGGGNGGGGESQRGGLPGLEDRVEQDEALIAALQSKVADLQGQNNWAVVAFDGTLVQTFDKTGGTATDSRFHLYVSCP